MRRIDGYLAETAYFNTWHQELAPSWLDHVALSRRAVPPRASPTSPFRFCDLGCGQGATVTLLAAALANGRFLGIDAMAEHIEGAAALARAAGLDNVRFQHDTFETALGREYRPFDYIVAHGVYTWVSPENQRRLVAFIDRFLKPGGIVYLSYNTEPGWTASLPLQRLVVEAARAASDGTPEARFDRVVDLVRSLKAAGARAFHGNPAVDHFLGRAAHFPKSYLVHEYMHDSWRPLYAPDVIAAMEEIGLSYLGAARLAENRDDFVLRRNQRRILGKIGDPRLQQLLRDYFTGQPFRLDVYQRHGRHLADDEAWERRLDGVVALTRPPEDVVFSLKTPAGSLGFDNAAARAIVAALDDGPQALREIARVAGRATEADVLNAADALLGSGQVKAVDPRTDGTAAARLNRLLRERALEDNALAAQVSPYGAAFRTSPLQLLFLETEGPQKAMVEAVVERLRAHDLPLAGLIRDPRDRKGPKRARREAARAFASRQRRFYGSLGLTETMDQVDGARPTMFD